MSKLTGNKLIVLAAVMGGTNLGMNNPDKKTVARLLARDGLTLESAVMALWSGYMESDEMCDMFIKECKWWLNHRQNFNKGKSKSCEPAYIQKVWPDIANIMGLAND
jgi:hypothetical protein